MFSTPFTPLTHCSMKHVVWVLMLTASAGCLDQGPATEPEGTDDSSEASNGALDLAVSGCMIGDVVYQLPYEQVQAYEHPDLPFLRIEPLDEVRMFLKSFECEFTRYGAMEGGLATFTMVGARVIPPAESQGVVHLELLEIVSDTPWVNWWIACAGFPFVEGSTTHIEKVGHHDLQAGWNGEVLRYRAVFPDHVAIGPNGSQQWRFHFGEEGRHWVEASLFVVSGSSDGIMVTKETPFGASEPIAVRAVATEGEGILFDKSWESC